ncbi:putative zinc finger protein [Chitinophaga skermanii]|uniref:Putative zinc finger protein n=1 Tax=Chitinophaga skermanii TaxID=331697 RepID=A0A327QSC8_9BACT|nr:tetratricopeptide repeat protein [Chitinophaga skermanii]RAJ06858.1 putative zinc finger protein [Chitinophaga skermanii]
MNNNSFSDERLFKIFSSVRCLNKEQLPRYLDGSMTDLEKHLIEQHLVTCDLCYDALHAVQHAKDREEYIQYTNGINNYIRDNIHVKPVEYKVLHEKEIRRGRTKDTLLSSFWLVIFFVLAGGGYWLIANRADQPSPTFAKLENPKVPQQLADAVVHDNEPPKHRSVIPANSVQPQDSMRVQNAVVKEVIPPPSQPIIIQKPDTTKSHTTKPATKPADTPVANTIAKEDKPAVQEKKDTEDVKEPAKEKEVTVAKNDDKPAKKQDDDAPAAMPSSDEYVYKTALLYQQQGDFNEAINQFKKISGSRGKYNELAKYQLAQCYKQNGQNGKARRLLKELAKGDGTMKTAAMSALNDMN